MMAIAKDKPTKPIKKYCPDCRRVPLTRHKHFWSCPTCGGELWDGNWIPGMEGVINISIPELMQGDIPIKRRRTIRSGRRRRKPVKKSLRHWLDDYY